MRKKYSKNTFYRGLCRAGANLFVSCKGGNNVTVLTILAQKTPPAEKITYETTTERPSSGRQWPQKEKQRNPTEIKATTCVNCS